MKKMIALVIFLLICCNSSKSFGADAVTVAVDAVAVRPMGIISSVVGSTLFVLTLPGTLIFGKVNESAHELILTPLRFTFCRHLGDTDFDEKSRCFERRVQE